MMSRLIGTGAVALGLLALAAAPAPADAASKGPPACAKIYFRPLPAGQNDGEQEAGLYTSRFSHVELKAQVKGGEAQNYYLTAHNQKLSPVAGALPAAAVNCAKAKKLPAPGKAATSCTGQRFAAVIAHAGKEKAALLYALHDRTWQYCSAGTLGS